MTRYESNLKNPSTKNRITVKEIANIDATIVKVGVMVLQLKGTYLRPLAVLC